MQAAGQSRLTESRAIIIAGAGIGGLTASLALAAKGFHTIVLEKSETLEEAGAGLQLSPNASRILIDLGLGPELASRLVTPESVRIMSIRTGKQICRIPLGELAARRYGAPYWIVHRADLQLALLARVKANPKIELRLDAQLEAATNSSNGVTVIARRGTERLEETALALVGADGVWSTVRQRMFPKARAAFTRRIAWRGSLDIQQLPQEFGLNLNDVHLWLGPDAHLVLYPMSGGLRVNVVVISSGQWNKPGWSEAVDAIEIKNLGLDRWPHSVRLLVEAVGSWRRWALFTVDSSYSWTNGSVALLGDAAHAMLPFAAQGAGMAIEDASVLADCVANTPGDIPGALEHYSDIRQARVARIQRAARANGRIYHLRGPMALARDVTIRWLSGERLLSHQDWIYGWRAR